MAKGSKKKSEADLEGALHAALDVIKGRTPGLKVCHQTTFTIRLGRSEISVDGRSAWRQGRADIVVYLDGKPGIVLELKKPGLGITDGDIEQGRSYALLLQAPLVMATDGTSTRLVETHSGRDWTSSAEPAAAVRGLLEAAAKVADTDLQWIVQRLLGPDTAVWAKMVRAVSERAIEQATGSIDDFLRPFADKFSIPRKASVAALDALKGGQRAVILSGLALAGKSNVLRQISNDTQASAEFVTLYVEGSASGLFEGLADQMRLSLDWPCTAQDIRVWLQQISQAKSDVALVLAIDGPPGDRLRADIETILSSAFGNNVRLVMALEDRSATSLSVSEAGRRATALGRVARSLRVGTLDNAEFGNAVKHLEERKISLDKGTLFQPELRRPDVLRMVVAQIMRSPDYSAAGPHILLADLAFLPSFARELLLASGDIAHQYRALAACIMKDRQRTDRAPEDWLDGANNLDADHGIVRQELRDDEIAALERHGWIRVHSAREGRRRVVAVVRAYMMAALADVLAEQLVTWLRGDGTEAARKLLTLCGAIPMGTLLGAEALAQAIVKEEKVPNSFIATLIAEEPKSGGKLEIGSSIVLSGPFGRATLKITGTDEIELQRADGYRHVIKIDPAEMPGDTFSNVTSWMILSYIASRGGGVEMVEGGKEPKRLDHFLIETLMDSRHPLAIVSPEILDPFSMIESPDGISVPSPENGLVEPLETAMARRFCEDPGWAGGVITRAMERRSIQALTRIDAVLRFISRLSVASEITDWARRWHRDHVVPCIAQVLASWGAGAGATPTP